MKTPYTATSAIFGFILGLSHIPRWGWVSLLAYPIVTVPVGAVADSVAAARAWTRPPRPRP